MQATMEILDRQEYISWKLPKNCNIILTSNPDNGQYQVNALDKAQQTRFLKFEMTFNLDNWLEWAYLNGIDERCINFMIQHYELINESINPRAIVTFFNSVKSIVDFKSSIEIVEKLAISALGNELSALFIQFITKKLDQLMSVDKILDVETPYREIEKRLQLQIGKDDMYRADIAAIISKKIEIRVNNVRYSKQLATRIVNLLESELFSEDLNYQLGKNILNTNPTKWSVLARLPKFLDIVKL